ncbi:MAG TPA: HEPN domain-containing protein [Nitrospirae bacterium]|nr:HEPN domain-containing protein [Nitrospirota bacterium]
MTEVLKMRVTDWIDQAKRTISSAEHSMSGGYYEDACFLSHHAAMLGVTGLLTARGVTSTGSSVCFLLGKVETATKQLLHKARLLDTFYVPSRYPYCFEKGAPKDYFDEETAKEAIESAKAVMGFVETELG